MISHTRGLGGYKPRLRIRRRKPWSRDTQQAALIATRLSPLASEPWQSLWD